MLSQDISILCRFTSTYRKRDAYQIRKIIFFFYFARKQIVVSFFLIMIFEVDDLFVFSCVHNVKNQFAVANFAYFLIILNVSGVYRFLFKVPFEVKIQIQERETGKKIKSSSNKQVVAHTDCPKLVESSEDEDDQEYMKKRQKFQSFRGCKWWNKVSKTYFGELNEDFVENMRKFTTSDHVMQVGGQICPLLPYYQEVLYSREPYIFMDDSIRVLYRVCHKDSETERNILVGYNCRPQKRDPQEKQNFLQQIWKLPEFFSFHGESLNSKKYDQESLKKEGDEVLISITDFTDDEQYIMKGLQYESIWRKQEESQIQKQIECWELELDCQHDKNQSFWDKIEQRIYKQALQKKNLDDQESSVGKIKATLAKYQTFLYFRQGYIDKTLTEYDKAIDCMKENERNFYANKTKNGTKQYDQFFQTDCKICFSTRNQPKNKVIYCDSCSTSFHQSCYGIETIEEDKQILCDACQERNNNADIDIVTCQICQRGKFPIKNINGHFYHVSCLVLFNFAELKQFRVSMKEGYDHERIIHEVLEHQYLNTCCQFCLRNSNLGMKFNCSFDGCDKFYHPICAYLNGCVFDVIRKKSGIDVKVYCRGHIQPAHDDLIQQVFLRRFLCNYKNTSKLELEQFKEIYNKELEKMQLYGKLNNFDYSRAMEMEMKPDKLNAQENKTNYNKIYPNFGFDSNNERVIQVAKVNSYQGLKQ